MTFFFLALVVASTLGVAARGPRVTPESAQVFLLLGFAGLLLLIRAARQGGVDRRVVLAVSGVCLVIAAAWPPAESNDVWAYAMYGRIVAHHHASPYTHSAASYPRDPWSRRVDKIWRKTPSVYGPVFTALSAAGMALVGHSATAGRLWFQLLAALAVWLALVLVDRRTGGDPVALALVGLNPVILISVVNGAHNDALVGLGVLAGVLLAEDRRFALAALAVAAAAMVKVIALLPLAALALWVWRRDGFRAAAVVAGLAGGLVVAGFVVGGGRPALHALHTADLHFTGGSIWNDPRRDMVRALVHQGRTSVEARRHAAHLFSAISDAVVLVFAAGLVLRRSRLSTPVLAVGASVAAYMLAAAYIYPWYVAWSLPALALAWRSRLTWLAAGHAALLHLAAIPDYRLNGRLVPAHAATFGQRFENDLYTVVVPIVELVLIAALALRAALGERYRWRPHSTLSEPAHRPARGCSPSDTGRVQGQQPIDA